MVERGRRSSWASDSRPKTSATPPTAACLRSNWWRCRTRASTRLFEISGRTPAPLGKSNNYSRTVAQRIGADPARDPRAYRRAGAAASGHRVRERDRRRQLRRGDVVRLREHLQPPVLRGPRRQAGPIRDRRGITRRPGLWIRRHLRRVHHRARIARRPSAIRAAGERSTGAAGPQASRTTGSAWANCSRRSPQSPPRIRSRHRRSSARSTSSPRSPRATG